ncbi:Protein arginine N-methyltransferase 1, partial [Talaromyces pinophilus]
RKASISSFSLPLHLLFTPPAYLWPSLHLFESLNFLNLKLTSKTMAEGGITSSADRMVGADHAEVRYFTSYDHHGIHEEMLKDDVRTRSYRDAIYQNKHIFKDKVVLDVGCGTGILSMFAVRAGAKHVIGVDMSSIIEKAREIVAVNGMADKITLLQGKMEEVNLPFPQVDIIVSEWMGYFLLYESMLDTVLYARDRYLAPGGKIFPDQATIYVAGIEDGEYKDDKIGFWDNVYGFNYSPMKDVALTEPLVDTVEMKAVVTDPCAVLTLDLYTVTPADLSFKVPYSLAVKRNDFIHAIIAWFDIQFTACHKPITFSTGPHAKYTHWKQTVFYLRDVLTVEEEESVSGVLENKPNAKNKRDLDIKLSYTLETRDPIRYAQGECEYKMC